VQLQAKLHLYVSLYKSGFIQNASRKRRNARELEKYSDVTAISVNRLRYVPCLPTSGKKEKRGFKIQAPCKVDRPQIFVH
jgi:hypothetical protein